MILKRCSMCGEDVAEALTWAVWAWMRADGQRVAYRQKLCVACMAQTVIPLHVACESPDMTCPSCGTSTREDMDPVYCTFIPRGLGKLRLEAPMCGPCAVELRNRAQKGAELLADRQPESRGQEEAPRPSTANYWASLGLSPVSD